MVKNQNVWCILNNRDFYRMMVKLKVNNQNKPKQQPNTEPDAMNIAKNVNLCEGNV